MPIKFFKTKNFVKIYILIKIYNNPRPTKFLNGYEPW